MNVMPASVGRRTVVMLCAGALLASSCNSLEVPDSNTATQARLAVERAQPRLSESLLASHGLEEIWYLEAIAADGGQSGIAAVHLLADGLFVVTQPARENGDRHLIRFHRQSGESIWYERLPGVPQFAPSAYHYSATAGKDPELYYAHEDSIVCLDLDTGRMLWSMALSIPISTSLVADEVSVFAGSDLKKCFAVPKGNSVETWTYVTGGRIEAAPLLVSDKVVFASHDGHVVGLDPAKGFDTIRSWDFATGARVRADLAAFDRWIFVGSEDYKLYCLRTDGSVAWSYVAEAPIVDAPVSFRVAPNRDFVFAISDRDALRRSSRALLAIPLPRTGDDRAQPIWRVENVRKIITVGRDKLYVLMEPGVAGERVLAAIDLATGKESFRIDIEGWNFVAMNSAKDGRDPIERGRIYLASQSGAIQVIGEKLR